MRGCLFCYPSYELNRFERMREGWDYQVLVER
jgi:hypothetical protein